MLARRERRPGTQVMEQGHSIPTTKWKGHPGMDCLEAVS